MAPFSNLSKLSPLILKYSIKGSDGCIYKLRYACKDSPYGKPAGLFFCNF